MRFDGNKAEMLLAVRYLLSVKKYELKQYILILGVALVKACNVPTETFKKRSQDSNVICAEFRNENCAEMGLTILYSLESMIFGICF